MALLLFLQEMKGVLELNLFLKGFWVGLDGHSLELSEQELVGVFESVHLNCVLAEKILLVQLSWGMKKLLWLAGA